MPDNQPANLPSNFGSRNWPHPEDVYFDPPPVDPHPVYGQPLPSEPLPSGARGNRTHPAQLTPEARKVIDHLTFWLLMGGQNFSLVNLLTHTIQPIQPGWLIAFTIFTIAFTAMIYRRFQ